MFDTITTCPTHGFNCDSVPSSSVLYDTVNPTVQVWVVPFALLQTQGKQLDCLSSHERIRASRSWLTQGVCNFSLGRSFLRLVLASRVHCKPSDICIQYSGTGKPFVSGGPAFNVSHCKHWLVVSVANNAFSGQIGVDVASPIKNSNTLRLADKCFTKIERDQLASYRSGVAQKSAFVRGWTRKEAVVKGTGMGLQTSLDSFDVSLDAVTERTSNVLRAKQNLLTASRLESVSPDNCELYDLGLHSSCEIALAIIHCKTAQPSTVRVVNVDEFRLNTLSRLDCG